MKKIKHITIKDIFTLIILILAFVIIFTVTSTAKSIINKLKGSKQEKYDLIDNEYYKYQLENLNFENMQFSFDSYVDTFQKLVNEFLRSKSWFVVFNFGLFYNPEYAISVVQRLRTVDDWKGFISTLNAKVGSCVVWMEQNLDLDTIETIEKLRKNIFGE